MSRGSDGMVVVRVSYAPFGQATVDLDPDGDNAKENFFVRFPGQFEDTPAGLHYNFFRTYDPQTGRYLEPDPIGQLGGLNVYAYAANNPIGLFDSMGLDSYLVCRPSRAGKGGLGHFLSHCFVANDADFPGDPDARIFSFGPGPEGLLDRNSNYARDAGYWESVAQQQCPLDLADDGVVEDVAFTRSPRTDDDISRNFEDFLADQDYAALAWYFGSNSNSAAFAIVNRDPGPETPAPPSNGRINIGADNWPRINFGSRR